MIDSIHAWACTLSDEVRDQVLAIAGALDALNSQHPEGVPNLKGLAKLAAPAFLHHGIVDSAEDIGANGRDQHWLIRAVVDDAVVDATGVDEIDDETWAWLAPRMWGHFNPFNPTSIGAIHAHDNNYVLCQYAKKGEETVRFYTRNASLVARMYVEPVAVDLRKAFTKAHKRNRLALDVLPELEAVVMKELQTNLRAGLLELPEAKADIKMVRNTNGDRAYESADA